MDETTPTPAVTPEPVQAGEHPSGSAIRWIALAVGILGWILSGFFGYSYKQTTDKLTQMQADATHQEAVTISIPVEVAGKLAYKTITKMVHDTQTQTVTVHDKTETTIRSSCTVGAFYSTRGDLGGYVAPDVFGFGPGAFQVLAAGSKDELIGGLGYRFNF
jgi:hypothetical protein